MLSYQHAFHAGNMADVHKHAMLAWTLDYLTAKPKPLSYIETHAGRALYDLKGIEAQKTGEAAAGIVRAEPHLSADHPLRQALKAARDQGGTTAYPGSPLIAQTLLRHTDSITLAERHPQEVTALRNALPGADIRDADGPALALSITPPTPRRGLLLIDPSYEVKTEYAAMPKLIADLHRKWPVGVLMLWYPILRNRAHHQMTVDLDALKIAASTRHELGFAPARPGHGMIGSGLYVVNPPWGWDTAAQGLVDGLRPVLG